MLTDAVLTDAVRTDAALTDAVLSDPGLTYLALTLAVLAVLAAFCAPVLRGLPARPVLGAACVLLVLTAVFDSMIVGFGLTVYDEARILGLRIGTAPVEDFGYTIAAVMLMPALWTSLGRWGARRGRSGDDAAAAHVPPVPAAPGARTVLKDLLAASRPYSWVNTAYPFAAGYLMATSGRIDLALVVGVLFFLFPYNLLMYGVNDVFDYASDLRNPRKGGIEGALADPAVAAAVHRRILLASALVTIPFVAVLLVLGDAAAGWTLALVVALVVAYSAPVLRFKERPVLDSLTSSMHFVGPLAYALVLADADLVSRSVWPVLVAFVAWGMGSHAFGAVQDVRADRAAGIGSVATVLGAHRTVVGAAAAYTVASAFLLLLPWPGTLAAALPLAYVANVVWFWRVRDDDCERANVGWRRFLVLNMPVGFLVTMLLIWVARS